MSLVDVISSYLPGFQAAAVMPARRDHDANGLDLILAPRKAALRMYGRGSDKHWGKNMKRTRALTGDWSLNLLFRPARDYRRFLRSLRTRMSLKVGALMPFCLLMYGCTTGPSRPPSTAFFYGSPVPVVALSKFERIVVEAENLDDLDGLRVAGADVFAYVSVGEAEGWRASSRALPQDLFLGGNAAWHSRIADLTLPGWQRYLIEERMATLWQIGYHGFFLDTLDSYQMVAKSPAAQLAQSMALVEIIRAMHQRFPGVQLLFNRGFEVLPEVGRLAVGLVAESLFQSWDPVTKAYVDVSEKDRNWLLARLNHAHFRYGIPITVIDYVPTDKPELAQEIARRITALGFASWVATPGLDTLAAGVKK